MKTLAVSKDTRSRNGRGAIKSSKTVLAFRRRTGYTDRGYIIFQECVGELVTSRSIMMEAATVYDMGNPEVVTITIEPGDTLNPKGK